MDGELAAAAAPRRQPRLCAPEVDSEMGTDGRRARLALMHLPEEIICQIALAAAQSEPQTLLLLAATCQTLRDLLLSEAVLRCGFPLYDFSLSWPEEPAETHGVCRLERASG